MCEFIYDLQFLTAACGSSWNLFDSVFFKVVMKVLYHQKLNIQSHVCLSAAIEKSGSKPSFNSKTFMLLSITSAKAYLTK